MQIWLFYEQYYQKLSFNEYDFKPLMIGSELEYDVTVRQFPFTQGPLQFEKGENGFIVKDDKGTVGVLTEDKHLEIFQKGRTLRLSLTPEFRKEQSFYLDGQKEVVFSASKEVATIHLQQEKSPWKEHGGFSLMNVLGEWVVKLNEQCDLYINGEQVEGTSKLDVGDVFQWGYMEGKLVERDVLALSSVEDFTCDLPKFSLPKSEMAKIYPIYRRTPRLIYDLPDEKITLTFPSQEQEDSSRGLWLMIMPPLVMLVVMGLVAIFIPRGIFIIISMVMFVMTIITSTVQYFREKSRKKRNEEKRRRVYKAYLQSMREKLHKLSSRQKMVLSYHFPSFEQMKQMTNHLSGRIWEKTLESHDALEFRLGTGSVASSYQLSLSSGDLANREIDDLLEQSQRIEVVYRQIPNAPITAKLAEGPLGLIGKESVYKRELHQIIGQLAFSHSYHDTRFVFVFQHEDYPQVEWMKWLPHFELPHMHAKGFIHNEKTRDQLLSSIYEILRERDLHEEKGKIKFTPQFIFIVTDYSLISEHVILEYLEGKNHAELGISVIFAAPAKELITENVHTLVQYVNEREGDILIEAKKAVRIPFLLDDHIRDSNERFARMLKTLNHQVGMTNSIPTSVSFLEMFGVRDVEGLPIAEYWQKNESAKSLAVPIGYKGRDDLIHLNLHEKAHGPHGLLAGTTGSGKSEFLQTYILSLAVNFHPHEVAFLLIDYKGGGMAQPFKGIPHLLGTITNIEGSRNFSLRALASINSELKRRQRLFDRYVVTHIDDYTRLYKEGQAEVPLPHLFLISDEFAELKNEEPEFIRELVSTARIGRSLGVHLILATQKPGGIIDEQIWSNSRFRVALKVQDASDSKEILKNGDAASITVTGRGYLQVGNNEVYELFQSAWSGAPYLEESFEGEDEVAIVTDLGLLPLSGIKTNRGKRKSSMTEIEAVTSKIAQTQQELEIQKLQSPWLPPLATRIEKIQEDVKDPSIINIAMIDEPEKQSQTPMHYKLMDDGNAGIFGSPGYGKSYTLLTMILGICEHKTPEEVNFYLLDYGNGSLLPLKQLPHTADYFTLDEKLKREKLLKFIKEEIARRKVAFQRQEVSNIKMYNAMSEQSYPLIYLVVDNFDLIREEMEELEKQLNQLGRDGQSLGIYLFVTATRPQSVRQSLMNSLKTKIVHYLMDPSEAYLVVGKMPYDLEPFPGRAVIKKESSSFSQIYLPASGKDDYEVLESLKQTVQSLKERYAEHQVPQPIPMLPIELTMTNFRPYVSERAETALIPIGLSEATVTPLVIDFKKNHHFVILGQAQRGKTNMLKVMLHEITEQKYGFIAIFDSFDRGLASFSEEEGVSYLETKEMVLAWLTEVEQFFMEREDAYLERMRKREAGMDQTQSYFVIDGYARFLQVADPGIQDRLSKLMKKYTHLGFNVIVSGNNSDLTKGFDVFTNELKLIRQGLLFMKKSEQTLFTVPYERKEDELPVGYGYYILNGNETKILTPVCNIERKILQ